jgi:hypothetical protein
MPKHTHLQRLDHVWLDAPVFFLTVCTQDRRHVLANDNMHELCVEVWKMQKTYTVGSWVDT